MGIVTLNHKQNRPVHYTPDHQILKNLITIIKFQTQITPEHNHLIIIETEIVQDDRSRVIDFETYATIIIHF